MARLLLENARIFDPGRGIDSSGRAVLIDGGVIATLDAPKGTRADMELDCRGRMLVPGLVDLRAHLCEPGGTRRETILTGTQAAARGGYTTLLAMPTTHPTIDRPEVVELILSRARAAGATRVLPVGALSVGREGMRLTEMALLKSAGCVAFGDGDRAVKDGQLLRYGLEAASELGVPIFAHGEDESLSNGGVMNEGLVSTRLALRASPAAAEAVGVARDVAVAELTGARLHLGHLSAASSVELIRAAKKRGVRVTADVCPLHLILTHEAVYGYDTRAKLWPPLRTREDCAALIEGLSDGTIDAVASDHLPQTELDKDVEFDLAAPGAIGLETTLPIVLGLVRTGRLTLARAIAVLTRGPANVLGRTDLGRLQDGGRADLVLIDVDQEWLWRPMASASKSSNTPLGERPFEGAAVLTIAGGVVTYRQEGLS